MKKILYIGNNLKKGKNVTVMNTLSKHLRLEGYHVITASSKPQMVLRLFDMIITIIKHAKSTDYVIIDTYSTLNFYYAFFCGVLCKVLKIKYIPFLHGGNLPHRLKSSKIKSSILFKNSYVNVAPSNYLMSAFTSAGFANTKYIPNSLAIAAYPFKERRNIAPKLLWVRAFKSLYNPTMAMEVLSQLSKTHPNATLCMVGPINDPSFEDVQKLVTNLGLTSQVRFTGKLSQEAWRALSQDYDIFLNTTNYDNTPISLLEAMALGLPVISTDVGGIPFLITDTLDGILVEKGNTVAMAAEIRRLISEPQIANRIAKNARQKVSQFDWEIVKSAWFSILN